VKEIPVGDTASTEATVSRYFTAWTGRDTATVRDLLADDFSFAGLGMQIEGREAFLDAGTFPSDARTTLVAQACQGSDAFQMYDSTRGEVSVRIVEHLRVEDGKITTSTFVTDSAAFMAFLGRM
jgi:ketosteroid isomerase-like protein